jgi:hypothetical protein
VAIVSMITAAIAMIPIAASRTIVGGMSRAKKVLTEGKVAANRKATTAPYTSVYRSAFRGDRASATRPRRARTA